MPLDKNIAYLGSYYPHHALADMKEICDIIRYVGPDGMFWDEHHFAASPKWPEVWSCCCEHCRAEYRKRFGGELPRTITLEVTEFRERSVYNLLNKLIQISQTERSDIHNQLCLMPNRSPNVF